VTAKQALLYVSPVVPSVTGNGLALTAAGSISLAAYRLHSGPDEELRRVCARTAKVKQGVVSP
jgi:hypothetical protein